MRIFGYEIKKVREEDNRFIFNGIVYGSEMQMNIAIREYKKAQLKLGLCKSLVNYYHHELNLPPVRIDEQNSQINITGTTYPFQAYNVTKLADVIIEHWDNIKYCVENLKKEG